MRVPKYRRRYDRGYAFVEYQGRRLSLPGKIDSPESLAAYNRLIQKILAEQAKPPQVPTDPRDLPLTVLELARAYLDHALIYYMSDGKPGSEYILARQALRALTQVHRLTPVTEFGPRALAEVRAAMIDGSWIPRDENGELEGARGGWSRKVVNKHIHRIQRMFRWGVSQELVPAAVWQALKSLEPLRAGRSNARETAGVAPVPNEHVEAVLPYLTPTVSAMVRLQRLTGMRSDNLCAMRPRDVDRSRDVWLYVPPTHKSKWRGKQLAIPLGPKAQEILTPFLDRDPEAFCFSPQESEAQRSERRRKGRKSPMTPSQAARTAKVPLERAKRTRYDQNSYRRAIRYGIARANKAAAEKAEKAKQKPPPPIPIWHPHQLRHGVGTVVRQRYGLEGAQVYLGHSHANVTEIYAERDLELALRIAREMG